jgi:hypothetical protein
LDLKLFNLLVDAKSPLGLDTLASKTGSDPILLGGTHGVMLIGGTDRFRAYIEDAIFPRDYRGNWKR